MQLIAALGFKWNPLWHWISILNNHLSVHIRRAINHGHITYAKTVQLVPIELKSDPSYVKHTIVSNFCHWYCYYGPPTMILTLSTKLTLIRNTRIWLPQSQAPTKFIFKIFAEYFAGFPVELHGINNMLISPILTLFKPGFFWLSMPGGVDSTPPPENNVTVELGQWNLAHVFTCQKLPLCQIWLL